MIEISLGKNNEYTVRLDKVKYIFSYEATTDEIIEIIKNKPKSVVFKISYNTVNMDIKLAELLSKNNIHIKVDLSEWDGYGVGIKIDYNRIYISVPTLQTDNMSIREVSRVITDEIKHISNHTEEVVQFYNEPYEYEYNPHSIYRTYKTDQMYKFIYKNEGVLMQSSFGF